MPINESTMDQKRKIKKKNVYPLGNSGQQQPSLPAIGNSLAQMSLALASKQQQHQQTPVTLNTSATAANNQPSALSKPRSRTEIYPNANAFVNSNSTSTTNTPISFNSPSQNHHHNNISPIGETQIRESSIGEVVGGSAQQSMLSRQRKN